MPESRLSRVETAHGLLHFDSMKISRLHLIWVISLAILAIHSLAQDDLTLGERTAIEAERATDAAENLTP